MKAGWVRQAAQIPAGLAKRFRALADTQGGGGVKSLTTIGLSLVVDMPEEYRDALVRYLAQKTVLNSDGTKPGEMYAFWRQMVLHDQAAAKGDDERDAKWYIDRILDPELTPEPGKKASDKQRRKVEGA